VILYLSVNFYILSNRKLITSKFSKQTQDIFSGTKEIKVVDCGNGISFDSS
jgi:hypothetical protein